MPKEQPRPRTCPVLRWCDTGNFPCYCEDAPAAIDRTPTPVGPAPGDRR